MFCFLSSCFTICKSRKNNNKASRYITREDLDVKYKTGVTKKAIKSAYDDDTKNASSYDFQSSRTITRVKVVMTKEEAKILFSQCDHVGTLSFDNMATTLTNIPANQVSLVSTSSPSYKKPIMLESIPEEP